MRTVWLAVFGMFAACHAQAAELVSLHRAEQDREPTFTVNGARTAVGSNLTFLATPLDQLVIHLNRPILLTVQPRSATEAVLRGPLQLRLFRLDDKESTPRPWGRAVANKAAVEAGAKADCLIFLTSVLAVYPQSGVNKAQFALSELSDRGWLTPDPPTNSFLPARYLAVFETQNDDNGIFRVEDGPAVAKYFQQGTVITIVDDGSPVRPGDAARIQGEIHTMTQAEVSLASKTGADVKCRTAGVQYVDREGQETFALTSCAGGSGAAIEMKAPGWMAPYSFEHDRSLP